LFFLINTVFKSDPTMSQSITDYAAPAIDEEGELDLAAYLDFLYDHRWLIGIVTLIATLGGIAYALLGRPIYQANMLIQVEDSAHSSKNLFGEISSMFDVKAAASAEMEILRSRMVVSRAVDTLQLHNQVRPKYFPVVGAWIASQTDTFGIPSLMGYGGYAWGVEKLDVSLLRVSESWIGLDFVLTAGPEGGFLLRHDAEGINVQGKAGQPLHVQSARGELELHVQGLRAKPGVQFLLTSTSRIATLEKLQQAMAIAELGKQSGVIQVTLEGEDPKVTRDTLNEIGREYVRQNVERKSEEAEKSLAFLDKQLPELRRQLELSETKYNQFRNSRGTIDLSEEAKLLLQLSVNVQTKLIDLKQKREELLIRFETGHPTIIGIDNLTKAMNEEIKTIGKKIKQLPIIEQDVLRLTRDLKLNTDLYTSLSNSAQQLRLVKAGKVGNARLLDAAILPEKPARPKRLVVIALAAAIGLCLGVVCAFIKKKLFGGIKDAHEIEDLLGLPVYATVPHSKKQSEMYARLRARTKKVCVLAHNAPTDNAIESLRSFHTALRFSMLDAKNNIVLLTGPTPGIGKSFISVNIAVVLAAAGKRVLLVDGDFRKGYLHQYFGLPRHDGLSDYIVGDKPLEHILHHTTINRVDFMSTGNLPPNPSDLLTHASFSEKLRSLSAAYDYVLIDTPPVLVVSDTLFIAQCAGAVFVIARAGISTAAELKESTRRLTQAGVTTSGVILNDMMLRPGRYGNGYKYGRYRHAEYAY
jgi:tyrosine-protein kinase Etk/Wzc